MKELMVHVEKAVRPLRATEGRKARMREELLTHLTGIFDEELARRGDRDAALAEALRRFGDPKELSAELQASVPRGEAVDTVLERWLIGPQAGSPLVTTLRIARNAAIFCAAVFGSFTASAALANPAALSRMWVGGAFLLCLCAAIVPVGLLYYRVRQALLAGPSRLRSTLGVTGWALLSAVTVVALGVTYTLLALGDWGVSLELLPIWLPGAVLVPCWLVGQALLRGRKELRQEEWARLDVTS